MSDSEQPVDIDGLEDFEAEFFGTKQEAVVEEDTLATENEDETETDEPVEDEAPEDEPEEDDEEEEEPEPQPEKKKSKTQLRIEQLLEKERVANERAEALEKRLAALEAGKEKVEPEKAVKDRLPEGAPSPDAVGDDGEPVYPLGEFDPNFIRDLTRFTINEERKIAKEQDEKEATERAVKAEQEALANSWTEKVEKAEAEIPEIRENISQLAAVFAGIDPNYGDYLAMTVMSSDLGPQIMNYLSQNIGEAQKIVASGPAAATLALGRLEAQLAKEPEEKRNIPEKKVSKAPEPPEGVNRGNRGQFTVRSDTDNLDAFEREFFNK